MIIVFQIYYLGDMEMNSSQSFAILSVLCNESENVSQIYSSLLTKLGIFDCHVPFPNPATVTKLPSAPINSIALDSADNLEDVLLSSSIWLTSISIMLSNSSHVVTNRISFCTSFYYPFFHYQTSRVIS